MSERIERKKGYKERIQKFKEAGDSKCIHQNKLYKVSLRYDMTYTDFIDLPRRTVSDKLLRDKHLILIKKRNMMDINVDLLQWITSFFDKKFAATRANKSASANTSRGVIKSEIILNQQLVEELSEN